MLSIVFADLPASLDFVCKFITNKKNYSFRLLLKQLVSNLVLIFERVYNDKMVDCIFGEWDDTGKRIKKIVVELLKN